MRGLSLLILLLMPCLVKAAEVPPQCSAVATVLEESLNNDGYAPSTAGMVDETSVLYGFVNQRTGSAIYILIQPSSEPAPGVEYGFQKLGDCYAPELAITLSIYAVESKIDSAPPKPPV